MKIKKIDRMYCDPEFKRIIKKKAIDKGLNVIDYTKDLIIHKKKLNKNGDLFDDVFF